MAITIFLGAYAAIPTIVHVLSSWHSRMPSTTFRGHLANSPLSAPTKGTQERPTKASASRDTLMQTLCRADDDGTDPTVSCQTLGCSHVPTVFLHCLEHVDSLIVCEWNVR